MLRAYKYRIYPTKAQEVLINKHIGAFRFIYNLALETKQMAYAGNKVNLSAFDLHKQLPALKEELTWLKEINSQSLQQSIVNLDTAFTKFFKGQTDFPKFKSKRNKQSFGVPQRTDLDFDNGKIHLPKFKGGIKIIIDRKFNGLIKQSVVSKTATGKYFISVLVDTKTELPKKKSVKERTTIGIDVGLKSFLTTSNGESIESPKYLRQSLSKLKYTQRKHSKYKGKRTLKRLATLHEKVSNQRKDFLHKISTKLIRENQSVAIEDLNVKGLIQNHNLALSISDAGWGIFFDMLEYKAEWYGKNILKIGRFDPSSKLCSSCGKINKGLKLSDREWVCQCGVKHDRDINAAINIKNFALRNYLPGIGRKNQNELPELLGVMTSGVNKIVHPTPNLKSGSGVNGSSPITKTFL